MVYKWKATQPDKRSGEKEERKHKGEAVRVDDESVTEEVAIEPSFFPEGQNICGGEEHHLNAAFVS